MTAFRVQRTVSWRSCIFQTRIVVVCTCFYFFPPLCVYVSQPLPADWVNMLPPRVDLPRSLWTYPDGEP